MAEKGYIIPIKKKIPLILFIKFVWLNQYITLLDFLQLFVTKFPVPIVAQTKYQ